MCIQNPYIPAGLLGGGAPKWQVGLNHATQMPPRPSASEVETGTVASDLDAGSAVYAEHGEGGWGTRFLMCTPLAFLSCKLGCHKQRLQQANSEV
jgi:hypothetical protein